ncbi:hypothetical protein D3C87_1441790 [compost metagenome]
MGRRRLDVVVQFHVGQLVPPDDAFLAFHGQRIPRGHVVQVLLHQHVAAARELGVFIADDGEMHGFAPFGVFSAVDKADDGAAVEVAETVHFVHHRHRIAQAVHQQGRHFKAQVHGIGADVQQDVARGRHGHALAVTEDAERVQVGRAWLPEQGVPGVRAERAHTGQVFQGRARVDGTHTGRDVFAPGPHGGGGVGAGVDRGHDKDGVARRGAVDGLGFGRKVGHGRTQEGEGNTAEIVSGCPYAFLND